MVLPLGCTSGKEKRNLDHIKRIASAQARRTNPPFVSEESETFCLSSVPTKVTHRFLAVLSAVLSVSDMLDQFCTLTRSNHHYEDRA